MNYTQPYVTLKDIVTSYLNQKNLPIDANFKSYMRMVVEHLTDLNIYTVKSSTVRMKATVDSNNIIKLPPDFVDWVAVGVVQYNVLFPILESKSMFLPTETVDLEPYSPVALADSASTWATVSDKYYSYDVRFQVEKELRYIGFTGYLVGKVIGVEYTTTGIKTNEKTLIPVELRRVLVDYLNYIVRASDDNIAEVKVQSAFARYSASLREFNKLQNNFTYADILAALRSGYTLGPKL